MDRFYEARLKRDSHVLACGPAPVQCLMQVADEKRIDLVGRYGDRCRARGSLEERQYHGGAQRAGPGSRVKDADPGLPAVEHLGHESGDGAGCQELPHLSTAPRVEPRRRILADSIDCQQE